MSSNGPSGQADPAAPGPALADEAPLTRWQKFRLVVKVVELRLRFVALMAVTGLVFAYWDTLWNRYDKWMRPAAERHAAVSGIEYLLPDAPAGRAGRAGQLPDLRHAPGQAEEGGEGDAARGGHGPRPAGPVPRRAGGHQDRRGGLRPADRDADDRRLRRVRRAAAGQHRLEGPGHVAGREALRQLHRPGRRGGRAPGRALQPRAVPGDPGAAQRGPARPEHGVRPQTAAGPLARWATAARWSALSAEKLKRWGITQAQIDEILKTGQGRLHGPDPLADRRARGQEERRRGAGGAGRLRDVRGRRPAHRLGPGPGLRAPARAWSARGRRSRRPSRRSRARRSRARSSSSSRTSTRRPARSRSGSPWTTPATGSGPGCSPR